MNEALVIKPSSAQQQLTDALAATPRPSATAATGVSEQSNLLLQIAERVRAPLKDWEADVRAGRQKRPWISWVFEDDYGSFENIGGDGGGDLSRRDALATVGLEMGLKVYYADLLRYEMGYAEGWKETPGDVRYDDFGEPIWHRGPPTPSNPQTDEFGNHEMDTHYGPITKFRNWVDIRHRRKMNSKLACRFDFSNYENDEYLLPQGLMFEPTGTSPARKSFEEKYNDDTGELTHWWRRSVLIMWPAELHLVVAIQLFGWRVAYLLDDANSLDESIELASKFLDAPGILKRPAEKKRDNYDIVSDGGSDTSVAKLFDECRDLFLAFSLARKQFDLFVSVLRKFGLPENNFSIINKAIEELSPSQETRPEYLRRCLAADSDTKRQIWTAVALIPSGELSEFFRKNIPTTLDLAFLFSADEVIKLAPLVGSDFFHDQILPSLQRYNDIIYWTRILKHFSDDQSLSHTAQKLAEHHTYNFERVLAEPDNRLRAPRLTGRHANILSWQQSPTWVLLAQLLECKHLDAASTMLQHIVVHHPKPPANLNVQDFLGLLSHQVLKALNSHKIHASPHQGLIHFFRTVVVKNILLPLYNPEPPNYALPAFKCDTMAPCPHCPPIWQFLTSSTLCEKSWSLMSQARQHIKKALTRYSHKDRIEVSESRQEGVIMLCKNGFTHAERVEAAKVQMDGFQEWLGEGEWKDWIMQGGLQTAGGFLKLPWPSLARGQSRKRGVGEMEVASAGSPRRKVPRAIDSAGL